MVVFTVIDFSLLSFYDSPLGPENPNGINRLKEVQINTARLSYRAHTRTSEMSTAGSKSLPGSD